jgi:hypothetical protein
VHGKIVRLFEDPAVYLCTGCKQPVHLDDVMVTHSDGVRCLCLRCLARFLPDRPGQIAAATAAQIAEASARGDPPSCDWPVW